MARPPAAPARRSLAPRPAAPGLAPIWSHRPSWADVARSSAWRRLVLLATLLALAVLEVFHPHPDSVAEGVEQGGWFLWFHMIQLVLTGLIALAVYLLTDGAGGEREPLGHRGLRRLLQRLRCGGRRRHRFVLRRVRRISRPRGQTAVYETAIDMPGLSLIFVLSIVGTAAWVVAGGGGSNGASACRSVQRPVVLLILAGVFLLGGHPFPGGTLAFSLLPCCRVARVRTLACRSALPRELIGL